MGMYTELVLKARVKKDIPFDVEAVLQYMFNGGAEPTTLPNHPFFHCLRWSLLGQCSSYYHHPFALSQYEEGYIFSRSDLKNYDGEIEKFIDFITPYLNLLVGKTCIGWSWYEEAEEPTLLFITKESL